MNEPLVLEGLISVNAAIESGNREIYVIYISKGKKRPEINLMEKQAKARNIKVERVKDYLIDTYAKGKTHGGVIALVGDRHFIALDKIIKDQSSPFVVMIDGIEDPYNFGFAVRSLYAAGVHGLIVRPRNWMSAAGVVAKSSAGATELIPTAIAETTEEAAEFLNKEGLTIACTGKNRESVSIYEANLTTPIFLVIGGEKRGITRSFMNKADLVLHIPYGRAYSQSLAATSATSILAFEIMRQRSYTG